MDNDELIDLASKWLENKKAAYLAKEDVITYYASLSGRKSEFMWHSLSVWETVRIIRATQMNLDTADDLKPKHIIAACQELDRVYSFSTKSRFKVADDIFNYFEEADADINDLIMSAFVDELYSLGYTSTYLDDLERVHFEILNRLNVTCSVADRRELFVKYLNRRGYELRTGVQRVVVNGAKQRVVRFPSSRFQKDIIGISEDDTRTIVAKVAGALR